MNLKLNNLTVPLILALPLSFSDYLIESKHNFPVKEEVVEIEEVVVVEEKIVNNPNLVEALIYVESRGKEKAIGDTNLGEPSVGVLQIRPIMVKEVNRILKRRKNNKRFNLKDRFSKIKSIEMFNVWRNYYHKSSTDEKIARCWNGGPLGWKNKSTLRYWSKVQKQLNNENI